MLDFQGLAQIHNTWQKSHITKTDAMIEIRIPHNDTWTPRLKMFYLLLVNSINPKTNLIEFMGSPMCRIDIWAFTNSNRKHVDSYIRELIADDVVINEKVKNKDLY